MTLLLDRTRYNIVNSLSALANATTMADIESNLDQAALVDNDSIFEEKEFNKPAGNLDVYTKNAMHMRSLYTNILTRSVKMANNKLTDLPHSDPYVDFILANFWKNEPLISGAVYSMSAKMSTLSWTVVGKKGLVVEFADMLDNAVSMGGRGWGKFLSATAQDFYTTNRGSFWYTPRNDNHLYGKLKELLVVDSLCCALSGNPRKPVYYSSETTKQNKWFRTGEIIQFTSMTSPREYLLGTGLCAVHRAYKSARILMGLSTYDWEKLNNLPPEGIAAVSGLSIDEFQDALAMWKAQRERDNSLVYPQVLWLLGSVPNAQVGVDFTGFSQIPESFNRKEVVDQYVNTLALVFGVDAREFWPISSGSLGTASESEIQHMKAKGKGPGEFMTGIERFLNGELPEDGGEFAFDTQDIGEDQTAAAIAKGWIDAFMPLYSPGSGTPPSKAPTAPGNTAPEGGASQQNTPIGAGKGTEPLITKDQFLRLLVDRRVLPNWVVQDDKVMRTDIGITEKELNGLDYDDNIVITYKQGKFEFSRPVITVASSNDSNLRFNGDYSDVHINTQMFTQNPLNGKFDVPYAQIKEQSPPNIKGKPINDKEALRGPRITKNTVKSEMQLWLETPELAAYVPTPEEHEYTRVLNSTKG